MTDSTPPPTDSPQTRRERMASRRPDRHWALIVVGVCIVAVLGLLIAFLRPGGSAGPDGRGAGGGQSARKGPGGDCTEPVNVRVAVTPEMKPIVERSAERAGVSCASVVVAAQSPDTTLTSLGEPANRPQLWIPDSSVHLLRGQSRYPDLQLSGGSAFATSPMVIAVPASAAKSDTMAWADAFARPDAVHLADPMTNSTGLMAVLSASTGPGAVTPSGPDGPTAASTTGPLGVALQRASSTRTADPAGLPTQRPQDATGTYLVSEQQFVRYTTDHPDSPLVALTPTPGTLTLDYRAVPLPTTDPAVADAVRALTEALTSADTQEDARTAGFRVPGDTQGPTVRTRGGDAPLRTTPLAMPGAGTIRNTIARWQSISSGMRLLAVVDTSGSMRHGDTGAGSRIQLAAQAAARGAAALPPNTDLGLWDFSAGAGKQGGWRELAPVARLVDGQNASHRDEVMAATRTLPTRVGGDTPLYDTVLAGVRRLHDGYDPKRIQAVIVMTDGRNDIDGGLDLPALLSALEMQNVPGREVSVATIAIGPDADRTALKKIADATGGAFFYAQKPEDIGTIVTSALMNFTTAATDADPLP